MCFSNKSLNKIYISSLNTFLFNHRKNYEVAHSHALKHNEHVTYWTLGIIPDSLTAETGITGWGMRNGKTSAWDFEQADT